jgi:hypothetical protein
MANKSLDRLRNLLMGAVLAGVCLAPAAWADGHLLATGQLPERTPMDAGIAQPIGHALAAARAALPHLIGSTLRVTLGLVQTSTPAGRHNGS